MNHGIDEAKVREEAKLILDKFARALEKVEKEELMESYIDREDFSRVEGEGEPSPKGFKERFLGNSPEHDSDFIIGEKGSWKWEKI